MVVQTDHRKIAGDRQIEPARSCGATIAAILGLPGSPMEQIADIPILTPPGINLFGTNAVTTRALAMMFNEVLVHCLASVARR